VYNVNSGVFLSSVIMIVYRLQAPRVVSCNLLYAPNVAPVVEKTCVQQLKKRKKSYVFWIKKSF